MHNYYAKNKHDKTNAKGPTLNVSVDPIKDPDPQEECPKCFASGFIWMDVDGVAAWAYCICKFGSEKQQSSNFKLPRCDYEMLSLFPVREFPLSFFVPVQQEDLVSTVRQKVEEFKAELKLSENFWGMG